MCDKDNLFEFFVKADDLHIKREKAKARDLRKSQWWKNQCGKNQCYFCNQKFASSELTMDHLVPIIRGGKTNRRNVVTACKDCNNKKKYLLPSEWEEYLIKIRNQDNC